MKIIYLISIILFIICEFRWSYNTTSEEIGNTLELPADGGNAIGIMTLLLFVLCEIFGVLSFGWLTIGLPYIFVLINGPIAQKKAIHKYIKDNEEAGISPLETIQQIIDYRKTNKIFWDIEKRNRHKK